MPELESFKQEIKTTKIIEGQTFNLKGFDCKACNQKGARTYIPFDENSRERLKEHLTDVHGVILIVELFSSYESVWVKPMQ